MTHQAQLSDETQTRLLTALKVIAKMELPPLNNPPTNAELKLHAAAAELFKEVAQVAIYGVKYK